jgi:alkaline phosphatase D
MRLTRRALIGAAPVAVAAPRAAWASGLSAGAFTHGVASGDPMPDRVMLWTRFIGGDGRVAWEISEDETFARVARRGEAIASFTSDFCVKVDAQDLAPDRRYFYRFLSASGPSATGVTRTAPASAADSVTVALFSCANLPFGYFHAYGHAAVREDIDLVLHAGDYIYEVPRGRYPSGAEAVPGRVIDPVGELVSLADYYQRYASYHCDPDLLELRRSKPISAVWDDHELVNNAWREGALDHSEQYEGRYLDRIAAASKAYFDWMPIRRPEPHGARVYRHLDWGGLARIILLDTRHIGRDRQIDYRATLLPRLAQGGAVAAAATAEFRRTILDDPNRTMLGAEQEAWLAAALADSRRRGHTWQIIAQQVVMGEQIAAAGITRLLPEGLSAAARQFYVAGEQAGALGLPWNLDSWNGYPAARARFLQACAAHASNAVVLGGDSHNCWLNALVAPGGGRLAAIEFAGGSVTSPGFERALSNAAPGEREALMRAANPHLAWCDLTNRGYAALRFTRTACEAEWNAFADVRAPRAPAPATRRMLAAASATGGPGAWTL